MSENRRALERFRNPLTVATMAAAAVAAAAPELQAADRVATPPTANRLAERGGEFRPLQPDLKALIKEVVTRDPQKTEMLKLINLPSRELFDFQAAGTNVRVVQVGRGFAEPAIANKRISLAKDFFRDFKEFSKTSARISIPVAEGRVEKDGRIHEAKLTAHYQVSSLSPGKDRVVFMIPTDIDIGYNPGGEPATFTQRKTSKIASFIRPDFIAGDEAIAVESCQSMVTVGLAFDNSFGVFNDKPMLDLLGQEIFCNSVGAAVARSRAGQPYDEYVSSFIGLKPYQIGAPYPNHNAYAASWAFIGNRRVYESLKGGVPEDIDDFMIHPKFEIN